MKVIFGTPKYANEMLNKAQDARTVHHIWRYQQIAQKTSIMFN